MTSLPDGGDVIAYQSVLADAGVYALKASPYLPQPEGPPVITAWTVLVSLRTGRPLLLVDSSRLTTERTAATTALAVDLLARPAAHKLALIGLGPVGRAHLRHVRLVREFDEVSVWSRSATTDDVVGLDGVHFAASADQAAAGADVVLLCTSAAAPVVDVRRLTPRTLVTSVSTNAALAHEIDPAALAGLDVYADHTSASFGAAGEMRIAARGHGFTIDAIRGDLPGLLSGVAPAPHR